MADSEDRLRCWAAGVQVTLELEAARENARHMLDLLQTGADPNSSTTFRTEAANYSLHVGAAELGIVDAQACGETPVDLSWIGEFRRLGEKIRSPATNEPDAHGQFEAIDSVIDWLRRDAAGANRPEWFSVKGIAKALPGRYPFIDAEAYWDSLSGDQRRAFVREMGLEDDIPQYSIDELENVTLGMLSGDAVDAIEGFVEAARLAGRLG